MDPALSVLTSQDKQIIILLPVKVYVQICFELKLWQLLECCLVYIHIGYLDFLPWTMDVQLGNSCFMYYVAPN